MRKEKILEILENAKDEKGAVPMRLVRTAFDKLPELCEDTISRQAAIDEISRWLGYLDEDMIGRIQMGLSRLPSAQPEIIRCKDCRFYRMDDPKACGYHHCWRNKGVNIFPMKEDDFCSRGERKADKE